MWASKIQIASRKPWVWKGQLQALSHPATQVIRYVCLTLSLCISVCVHIYYSPHTYSHATDPIHSDNPSPQETHTHTHAWTHTEAFLYTPIHIHTGKWTIVVTLPFSEPLSQQNKSQHKKFEKNKISRKNTKLYFFKVLMILELCNLIGLKLFTWGRTKRETFLYQK